jgi:hypothetical protein
LICEVCLSLHHDELTTEAICGADPKTAALEELAEGERAVVVSVEEGSNRSHLCRHMRVSGLVIVAIGSKGDEVESSNHAIIEDVASHSGNLDDLNLASVRI